MLLRPRLEYLLSCERISVCSSAFIASASGTSHRPMSVGNACVTSIAVIAYSSWAPAVTSAERHRQGQPRFAGFLVLLVHVLGRLCHRRDRLVEADAMAR